VRLELFRPPTHYQPARERPYEVLPFRFMRWSQNEVLLTTDAGEFAFLTASDFMALTEGRLPRDAAPFRQLKAKHILSDTGTPLPLQLLATKFRTKKAFLEGFTKLHIFVVTLRCDHSCPYCQVSRVSTDRTRFDMSRDTAEQAIALMFQSPSPDLKVEFQGGESLLNTDLIRFIVERVNARNANERRNVEFVIATNLSELSAETLALCAEHQIHLSTSLDGPAWLHNANRPRPGGDSHERVIRNLGVARAALGRDRVSALMTTTTRSLDVPQEIVDEYVAQGFDHMFLRPISPYGFAVRARAPSYDAQRFLRFYESALQHIIEVNRRGTPFMEVYAQLLLRKMLTPFPTGYVDLQSPAGLGIGCVVYNYDGDVYASDEGRMLAEMKDDSFRLGNVHHDSYREIFGGPTLRALTEHSVSETLPGCADCAFVPYCGADPTFHWATQGDPIGHRPTSGFCSRNMGIIRLLFELVRNGDEFTQQLLLSWAVGQAPVTRGGEL
jgi:His-Xaa-Ser system radical SAM maturase HxsB